MAERNKHFKAIILSLRELGENNRLAQIISAENGIFNAILYGGPKSKLKSLVQPFYSGELYVYSDESKNSIKIVDFDVTNYHISFREDLLKSWTATFASELIIKTKCAGDNEKAFTLLAGFLDGVDLVNKNEVKLGTLRFLWRYLELLGLQPEPRFCSSCGESLLAHEKKATFVESQNGFICSDCLGYNIEKKTSNNFDINLDALTYLTAINELKPYQVRKLLISKESVYDLNSFLFFQIEKICKNTNIQLETLKSGIGIL